MHNTQLCDERLNLLPKITVNTLLNMTQKMKKKKKIILIGLSNLSHIFPVKDYLFLLVRGPHNNSNCTKLRKKNRKEKKKRRKKKKGWGFMGIFQMNFVFGSITLTALKRKKK